MAVIQILTTYDQGKYSACEALWYDLAEVAKAGGHEVEVLTGKHSEVNPRLQQLIESEVNVKFYTSPPTKGWMRTILHKMWLRFVAPSALAKGIASKPDIRILNVGTMVEAGREPWATLLESSESPTAVIVHSNSEIRSYAWSFDQRLSKILRETKRAYFVSDRLRQNAEEQLLVNLKSARLVKNPVNLSSRELEPWPDQEMLSMAIVGRLDSFVKGHVRLLSALSSEIWMNRKWKLGVFGSGPDLDKIKTAVKFYGLQEHVVFEGFVDDIRGKVWRNYHVLAMPSMLEGMSMSLVEAMICGRPVLCSDVGGAKELIRNGENGFIARSPFSAQLSESLECMWEARESLQEMGKKAHEVGAAYLPDSPGEDLLVDILESLDLGEAD